MCHTCQELKRQKHKWEPKTRSKYRNENAIDPTTISRRLDNFEEDLKEEQNHVHKQVCMKTKFVDRAIVRKEPWFMNHKMLNNMIEKKYLQRETAAWNNYINNPQRLINIVYTCVNGYLSYNAMQSYRIAVRYTFCSFLFDLTNFV